MEPITLTDGQKELKTKVEKAGFRFNNVEQFLAFIYGLEEAFSIHQQVGGTRYPKGLKNVGDSLETLAKNSSFRILAVAPIVAPA